MDDFELLRMKRDAEEGVSGLDMEGGGPSQKAWQSVFEDVPRLVEEVRRLQKVESRARELWRNKSTPADTDNYDHWCELMDRALGFAPDPD